MSYQTGISFHSMIFLPIQSIDDTTFVSFSVDYYYCNYISHLKENEDSFMHQKRLRDDVVRSLVILFDAITS